MSRCVEGALLGWADGGGVFYARVCLGLGFQARFSSIEHRVSCIEKLGILLKVVRQVWGLTSERRQVKEDASRC